MQRIKIGRSVQPLRTHRHIGIAVISLEASEHFIGDLLPLGIIRIEDVSLHIFMLKQRMEHMGKCHRCNFVDALATAWSRAH